MNNGIISVVVPVYNVEQYIGECIDSILKQTYQDLELLLVDDGSTDTSRAICESYASKDERILVLHKANGGVSSARNYGLRHARGEYIAFVDGDDWIEDTRLEAGIDQLIREKSDMCAFCSILQNGEARILYDLKKRLSGEEAIRELFKYNFPTSVWACIYRRGVLTVQFDENIHFLEDLEFFVLLLKSIGFISVNNQALYNYRIRDNSANNSGFNKKILTCLNITSFISENCKITKKELGQLDQRLCLAVAIHMAKNKYYNAELAKCITIHSRDNIFAVLFSGIPITKKTMSLSLCSSFSIFRYLYCKIKLDNG